MHSYISSKSIQTLKQDFENLLKSKDTTISDLQERLKKVNVAHNELKSEHDVQTAELTQEITKFSEMIIELRTKNTTLVYLICIYNNIRFAKAGDKGICNIPYII